MTSKRSLERLSAVIKERAAAIVLFELKDPRVGFVTITRVKLSPDFSQCRIFYSVLGKDGDKSKTAHALADARGFIQKRIGASLRTRSVPHIEFTYDESIEGAIRMGELLRGIDDTEPPSSEDPASTGEGPPPTAEG